MLRVLLQNHKVPYRQQVGSVPSLNDILRAASSEEFASIAGERLKTA